MKKKKALAVLMALTMATGACMTAWAEPQEDPSSGEEGGIEGHSPDSTEHGTDQEALVSDETSEMSNSTDQQGQTQFYIKVDKDATSGTVTIPSSTDYTGDGDVCHYDVEWEVTRKSNLSVTVPLYVCMYGYGGDGKVVTPDEDAYYMTNSSKYRDYKEVESITPCYKVKDINAEREAYIEAYTAGDTTPEKIEEAEKAFDSQFKSTSGEAVTISETYLSGEWGCFTKDDQNYVVRLSDCGIHENSECANSANMYFYKDSENTLDKASYVTKAATDTDAAETEEIAVGDRLYAAGSDTEQADLPVNVPTIKAEIHDWDILPTDASLQAGEIAMTINGVDLYDVNQANDNGDTNTMDISALNWGMNAANDNKLSLPIYAVIAGGNVNEEGCVPVVRVTYKIAPAMELIANTKYETTGSKTSDNVVE